MFTVLTRIDSSSKVDRIAEIVTDDTEIAEAITKHNAKNTRGYTPPVFFTRAPSIETVKCLAIGATERYGMAFTITKHKDGTFSAVPRN